MNNIWSWIAGILVSLLIIALVVFGSPGRQAYYRARGVIVIQPQTATIHIGNSPLDVAAWR